MKKDLTNKTFGRLTVVKFAGRTKDYKSLWLCQCECGKTKIVQGYLLSSGNTRSCGCYQTECRTKHGHARHKNASKEYHIWNSMIQRCHNQTNHGYPYYGKRGIKVCKRWHKFENFLEDMGQKPKGLTLDRIDNDGNYEPHNCRWVSRHDQNRNMRNNIWIEYKGKRLLAVEWDRLLGYAQAGHCTTYLLNRGWTMDKIVIMRMRKVDGKNARFKAV